MNFLKPTKQKVIGTIIVLIALFIGSFVNEAIANLLLPEELLTADLENALTDLVGDNMEGLIGIGLKILAINLLVNIFVVYISMCLILREKGKR